MSKYEKTDVVASQWDIIGGKMLTSTCGALVRYDTGSGLLMFVTARGEPMPGRVRSQHLPLYVAKRAVASKNGYAVALWGVANPGCVLIECYDRRVRLKFDVGYWWRVDDGTGEWEICVGPTRRLDYKPEREEGWGDE